MNKLYRAAVIVLGAAGIAAGASGDAPTPISLELMYTDPSWHHENAKNAVPPEAWNNLMIALRAEGVNTSAATPTVSQPTLSMTSGEPLPRPTLSMPSGEPVRPTLSMPSPPPAPAPRTLDMPPKPPDPPRPDPIYKRIYENQSARGPSRFFERAVKAIGLNNSVIGASAGWIAQAWNMANSAQGVAEAYKALTPDDNAVHPNYTPPGMPRVPTRCASAVPRLEPGLTSDGPPQSCTPCFEKAQGKLAGVRIAFEKLRRINAVTQSLTTKSLAFGDSVSAIHGVAALGWQPERARIEQALADFNVKHDMKYEELLGNLREALQAIAHCEAQHFKEPDWYNRYGFMYYSFMADRYRR